MDHSEADIAAVTHRPGDGTLESTFSLKGVPTRSRTRGLEDVDWLVHDDIGR